MVFDPVYQNCGACIYCLFDARIVLIRLLACKKIETGGWALWMFINERMLSSASSIDIDERSFIIYISINIGARVFARESISSCGHSSRIWVGSITSFSFIHTSWGSFPLNTKRRFVRVEFSTSSVGVPPRIVSISILTSSGSRRRSQRVHIEFPQRTFIKWIII